MTRSPSISDATPGSPAVTFAPTSPESDHHRFLDDIAVSNLQRMIIFDITSIVLSFCFMLANILDLRDARILVCQTIDLAGSSVFLFLFWLGLKHRLSRNFRWALSPVYFAFWLTVMAAYYFLAFPIYGEITTFVLGAIAPAVIILLPPRYFLSLLIPYYVAFCVFQIAFESTDGGWTSADLFAQLLHGTLAVLVATLAAWFLYSARWTSFQREQLLARRTSETRRAESHLRAILENIPFQAWLKDMDDRFLAVNREFVEAVHHDYADIIGKSTIDLYPPSEAEKYVAEDQEIIRSGKHFHIEHTVEEGGAIHWYEVFKRPVFDNSNTILGTAGLARDITARKEMEESLVAAREKVVAADRAKSDFLAVMSHEIRTPMNSVLGYAELLQDMSLDATQSDYVESILNSGRLLLTVINDILDFSKIEAGGITLEKKVINLREFAASTLHLFEPLAAKKNLHLHIDVTDTPEQVFCDPLRIQQILFNLLSNAVKFTNSGSITLRVFADPISLSAEKLLLHFEVIDTGIGIDTTPENLARIFEPFHQADTTIARRFSGTGLGLVIAQRLCRLMDGDIQVHSIPGQGSTFAATVKLEPNLSEPEPPIPQPANVPDLTGLHVLVVEDNASNRKLVAAILQRWGVTADLVESGEEAIKAVSTRPYQAILMDVQMPGLDGFETTRHIRQWESTEPQRKKNHIIALTALAMSGDVTRCIEAGMDDYLAKPIHPPSLQQALSKAPRSTA